MCSELRALLGTSNVQWTEGWISRSAVRRSPCESSHPQSVRHMNVAAAPGSRTPAASQEPGQQLYCVASDFCLPPFPVPPAASQWYSSGTEWKFDYKKPTAMKMLVLFAISIAGSVWALLDTQGVWPHWRHAEDVIYGRKDGLALTMDVFTPEHGNGAAIVSVISAGFRSSHAAIDVGHYKALLERGYTVFAVVHGSQPKYTMQEIPTDIHRAVRFIRYRAADFHIDPNRIGIMGASAGGHLSLLLATTGCRGDPGQKDPVERQSSQVQAAACFFPLTDFLNYGAPGTVELGCGRLAGFRAAFDFHRFDVPTGTYQRIRNDESRRAIGKDLSPAYYVSGTTAPCLIIHGDADELVPIQQSRLFAERMKVAGAPIELVAKHGAGHGWPALRRDLPTLADWFDRYLARNELQRNGGNAHLLAYPLVLGALYLAGLLIRRLKKTLHV